jgi:hypothetical protein
MPHEVCSFGSLRCIEHLRKPALVYKKVKVNLSLWQVPCFHAGMLLGFFDSEGGGYMFLRNVGWLSTDYTALYPRR